MSEYVLIIRVQLEYQSIKMTMTPSRPTITIDLIILLSPSSVTPRLRPPAIPTSRRCSRRLTVPTCPPTTITWLWFRLLLPPVQNKRNQTRGQQSSQDKHRNRNPNNRSGCQTIVNHRRQIARGRNLDLS